MRHRLGMIGSLFKELTPVPQSEDGFSESRQNGTAEDESGLLAALPVVQKIADRKARMIWHLEAPEIVQRVVVRLLNWRRNHHEHTITEVEWKSIAAKATFNEIKREFISGPALRELPIDEALGVADAAATAGESAAELSSLANAVWREIARLSLRQRRALLLHNEQQIIFFLQCGIKTEEIAAAIEISLADWTELCAELPLTDLQIAARWPDAAGREPESMAKSIKKARFEARAKLRSVLKK